MTAAAQRAAIVQWAGSLFIRGLTPGSSGNISVRVADGFLMTPTNACLGFLDPARLSLLDASGAHVAGDPPTKERPLHLAFYQTRPEIGAVVHLHSTYATALSCLSDIDPHDAIPAITPYVVMRVGRVPVLPYARPGAPEMAALIGQHATDCTAVLLGNHGPVVAAPTLAEAVFAIEELEETAKLVLLTRGLPVRTLSGAQVAELHQVFRKG